MKNLFILFFLITTTGFSQSTKEELFKQDVATLVEEMEFMYGYDQLLREYLIFKSLNKMKQTV